MFLEDKAEGEPQKEWPDWYLFDDEPVAYTYMEYGCYSYVVLPHPK